MSKQRTLFWIELLISLGVVSILAIVAIESFKGIKSGTRESVVIMNALNCQKYIEGQTKNGICPTFDDVSVFLNGRYKNPFGGSVSFRYSASFSYEGAISKYDDSDKGIVFYHPSKDLHFFEITAIGREGEPLIILRNRSGP